MIFLPGLRCCPGMTILNRKGKGGKMRRSEDERDKLVREEGKAARRILRGFFTVLSVAACFVVLCLFAYFFRIASSDRTFRLEDFPNRLKQDIARLNDPNTKI